MDTNKLEALKRAVSGKFPEEKVSVETVRDLIGEYEGIVRSETFWGERAPKLVDEVNALRPLESSLRAIVQHAKLVTQAAEQAEAALVALDEVRAKQAAS